MASLRHLAYRTMEWVPYLRGAQGLRWRVSIYWVWLVLIQSETFCICARKHCTIQFSLHIYKKLGFIIYQHSNRSHA
ncbi:hypothetical protein B0J17DRAFT_86957 [Rhizoctonia solani]|nr:hypothetical protein B0J17DRAFT_86957 [Rhizoctonia solani]